MDIGGLETVVANSAYVSARGGGPGGSARDRKHRARLRLPHISQCEALRARLAGGGLQNGVAQQDGGPKQDGGGEEEASVRWQCVEQPIGKRLFRQFLQATPGLAAAGALWEELEAFECCEEGERSAAAANIRKRFFTEGGAEHCAFLSAAATAPPAGESSNGGHWSSRGSRESCEDSHESSEGSQESSKGSQESSEGSHESSKSSHLASKDAMSPPRAAMSPPKMP